MTKHSGDVEGYFLANRSLPWWAVGLSVMATQLSAITLVGTTGQAYSDGMRFIQFYYGLPLAMVILCITAVPFFYRAKVYTAYEYLEKRFDAKTRSLTSFFFLISRGFGVGVVIAAPSVILSIVLGWNEVTTIFVMGLSTTFYTMIGGVQAVTWTDVKQMIVIFFGLSVVLIIILSSFPAEVSISDGLHLAGATGRLTTIDTSFDLKEKYTIWSGLIGALFLFLSYFGCDQSQVQRFLTAKSVSRRQNLAFDVGVFENSDAVYDFDYRRNGFCFLPVSNTADDFQCGRSGKSANRETGGLSEFAIAVRSCSRRARTGGAKFRDDQPAGKRSRNRSRQKNLS